MIGQFWHALRSRIVRPAPKATPFVQQMRDVRCEAIAKTRQSLHAQREDRARRERTNRWADDQFAGPPRPERRDR